MKKQKNLIDEAEKVANGMTYYIVLIAVFLIMFFAACYILNGIIDPCLEMLESLAENALRVAKAVIKILLVGVFLLAIYKVFFESENE